MAARQHRETHDVEQTKKMIPLITCEITCSQHVCGLVFGVSIFDLDLGSGHVSHRRTSALYEHFDQCLNCLQKCTTELRSEKVLRL